MDINGSPSSFEQMQAMQQFEQFVQNAMGQALTMLSPGYRPTVIFSFKGRPDRDIIITAAGLDDVFKALASKMQANGLAVPQQVATAPANDQASPDLHLALINIVAAARRMAPLLDGFAENHPASVVRKRLLDAIKADGVSETARRVVAGYISTLPGMHDDHPERIDSVLEWVESGQGALIFGAGRAGEQSKPQ